MASRVIRLWVIQPRGDYQLLVIRKKTRKLPASLVASASLTPNHRLKQVKLKIIDLCDYTGSKWRAVQREAAKIEKLVKEHTRERFPGYALVR